MQQGKFTAIIVAGGSGTRFGGSVPKQFLELCGRPVLMHTIAKFYEARPATTIVVVLPESQQGYWRQLCADYDFKVPYIVVSGGDSRFASVKNAIDTIEPSAGDFVAVHDGVRPLLSADLINRTWQEAAKHGSAVPVVPVTDSVRMVAADGVSSHLLDRSTLRAVQTPQVFDAIALKQAYDQPYNLVFTDDASVYEHAGNEVWLVDGEVTNIKITNPRDLDVALSIMKQ